jgi:glycosyltransferase involved in cell wall biosynthesis
MSGSQKKRVLHVIDSLDLGGAQVVLENLVRHADRDRFDLDVAVMHGRGVFLERLEATGVPVHSMSSKKWLPIYIPRLAALIRRRRYDVAHCHLIGSNIIAKPIAAALGVRVRINHDHCNDKSTLSPWMRWADRKANRLSSHVIAVSESTRAGLLKEGLDEERVTTIHNGLDLERSCPRPGVRAEVRDALGLPSGDFVIGGMGRLVFQKNFPLFVEVAQRVCAKYPRARFVIAGTGPDESGLRAQIAALGLGDKVKLLGFMSDANRMYAAIDALLMTSRYEGLPMTILEAMASAVPIVASDLDGMREILADGVNAALVAPGDADGFASAVGEVIDYPDVARGRAAAALKLAREKFSAQAMTRQVEALYERYLRA